jgi:hypothetical protein
MVSYQRDMSMFFQTGLLFRVIGGLYAFSYGAGTAGDGDDL